MQMNVGRAVGAVGQAVGFVDRLGVIGEALEFVSDLVEIGTDGILMSQHIYALYQDRFRVIANQRALNYKVIIS